MVRSDLGMAPGSCLIAHGRKAACAAAPAPHSVRTGRVCVNMTRVCVLPAQATRRRGRVRARMTRRSNDW